MMLGVNRQWMGWGFGRGLGLAALALGLAACGAVPLGDAPGGPPLRFLKGSMPRYPAAAKAAGQEGWVRVRYRVTAAGGVEAPVVLEAMPPGVFEAAALQTVLSWRYADDPRGRGWDGVESVVRFQLGERSLPNP